MQIRRLMRLTGGLLVVAGAVAPADAVWSQAGPRKSAPTGQEIAEQAKGAKLDRANATTAEVKGKKITLTPAVSDVKGIGDLQAGTILGTLETELAGDETGLPAGKYDLLVAQVGEGWHVFAEAGGRIVKEAVRVKVEKVPAGTAGEKPQFHTSGWGTTYPAPPKPPCDPCVAFAVTGYW